MKLNEKLTAEMLGSFLPETDIIFLEETDSTNREARTLAAAGAREGTLVVAGRQTAGRGRLGRSFFSPDGGLYMSLILRPQLDAVSALMITTAAATAAAEAIERVSGRGCKIKWVNDVYIAGRKVCGILTEGVLLPDTGRLEYAVLGVGINVSAPKDGFPEELTQKAGSVFAESYVPAQVKCRLAGEFVRSFFGYYRASDSRSHMAGYRKRSLLDGRIVSYEKNGVLHSARVVGVDDDAHLLLDENSERITLSAGEVSVTF